jgi:hypothetical protein
MFKRRRVDIATGGITGALLFPLTVEAGLIESRVGVLRLKVHSLVAGGNLGATSTVGNADVAPKRSKLSLNPAIRGLSSVMSGLSMSRTLRDRVPKKELYSVSIRLVPKSLSGDMRKGELSPKSASLRHSAAASAMTGLSSPRSGVEDPKSGNISPRLCHSGEAGGEG